jgi:hypothetical protein
LLLYHQFTPSGNLGENLQFQPERHITTGEKLMRCQNIEKEETWKNHIVALETICARNVITAKRLRKPAGAAEALRVINNAKAALANRLNCEPGKCPEGSNCVKPSINDVVQAAGATYKVEVTPTVPQPEDSDCEANEALYDAQVVVSFAIKAKCKCEKKAKENPIKYIGEPLEKATKRSTKKRTTRKSFR